FRVQQMSGLLPKVNIFFLKRRQQTLNRKAHALILTPGTRKSVGQAMCQALPSTPGSIGVRATSPVENRERRWLGAFRARIFVLLAHCMAGMERLYSNLLVLLFVVAYFVVAYA